MRLMYLRQQNMSAHLSAHQHLTCMPRGQCDIRAQMEAMSQSWYKKPILRWDPKSQYRALLTQQYRARSEDVIHLPELIKIFRVRCRVQRQRAYDAARW